MNVWQRRKDAMRSILMLVGAVSLTLSTSALARSDEERIVGGTVDHSEWGEPGNLQINLDTGQYRFSPGVWTIEPDKGQPRGEPLSGTIGSTLLTELNTLAEMAKSVGLVDEQCAAIDRSERSEIIVSTGGSRQVTLSLGGHRESSHPDLECWTSSANAIRDMLQAVVDAERAID